MARTARGCLALCQFDLDAAVSPQRDFVVVRVDRVILTETRGHELFRANSPIDQELYNGESAGG